MARIMPLCAMKKTHAVFLAIAHSLMELNAGQLGCADSFNWCHFIYTYASSIHTVQQLAHAAQMTAKFKKTPVSCAEKETMNACLHHIVNIHH